MTTSGELKRRPIRGALWGLLLGIGVIALLVMYSVIAVGTLTPWVVLLAFIVLGALWGAFGPAKQTRDLPPSRVRSVPTATTAPGAAAGAAGAAAAAEAGSEPFAPDAESGSGDAANAEPGPDAEAAVSDEPSSEGDTDSPDVETGDKDTKPS
jgi:hypothetical protein